MNKEKLERNKEMFKLWKTGKYGYKKLAKMFNLHYTTVGKIILRWAGR